jgi:hypothetical protein
LKIECVINCVISTPGIILQGPCETWVGVFDPPSLDDGDSRARDRIANHHLLVSGVGCAPAPARASAPSPASARRGYEIYVDDPDACIAAILKFLRSQGS